MPATEPTPPVPAREAVVVRPGDVLLVRVGVDTPVEALCELRDQLVENIGDQVRVLVLACEQLAVVRGADS